MRSEDYNLEHLPKGIRSTFFQLGTAINEGYETNKETFKNAPYYTISFPIHDQKTKVNFKSAFSYLLRESGRDWDLDVVQEPDSLTEILTYRPNGSSYSPTGSPRKPPSSPSGRMSPLNLAETSLAIRSNSANELRRKSFSQSPENSPRSGTSSRHQRALSVNIDTSTKKVYEIKENSPTSTRTVNISRTSAHSPSRSTSPHSPLLLARTSPLEKTTLPYCTFLVKAAAVDAILLQYKNMSSCLKLMQQTINCCKIC